MNTKLHSSLSTPILEYLLQGLNAVQSKTAPAAVMLIVLALLGTACNLPANPTAVITPSISPIQATSTPVPPLITPTLVSTPTVQPTLTVTPIPLAGRSAYHFKVKLNVFDNSAEIEETIHYASYSLTPLSQIMISIPPKNYSEVFSLRDLLVQGQVVRYEWLENHLRVPLPSPLNYGEKVDLQIKYHLNLPECYCEFGYTQYQINLGDWYPFIPPLTENGEWIINKPGWVGEYIVSDLADFSLELDPLPSEWKVASNALPDPAQPQVWKLANARNLTLSLSSLFEVFESSQNDVLIQVYAFSAHAEGAKAALKTASEALMLYSDLLGPYPHPSLTIVDAVVPDGMEYDGLFLLSHQYFAAYDSSPKNYLTILTAHETAHQWFAGRIASDPVAEPWLDETLCTFFELVYFEKTYPELADWWLTFRILDYNPQGAINQPATNFLAFRPYVDATYLRGALFLKEVRALSTPEVFLQALSLYSQVYQGKRASGKDFLQVLAQFYPAEALNELEKRYLEER